MVSNYERILSEIQSAATQTAPKHGLNDKVVVDLIMNIVDLVDRDRIKAISHVDQQVRNLIELATPTDEPTEDC